MRYTISIRGKQEQLDVSPGTVSSLRKVVLEHLQETPLENGVQLEGQDDVLLFKAGSKELLQNGQNLDRQTTYYAYEKFATAPLDLYRTVKLSQIHPAVRSVQPSQFTKVVPLYCAALTQKEAEYPPYDIEGGKHVRIHGCSLQSYDRFTMEATEVMPWNEVSVDEEKSESRVDLETEEIQQSYDALSDFGVLHSKKLYFGPNDSVARFDCKAAKKGSKVKRRTLFWRYILPKGTALQDVGMSLICDKHDGHFSLIPDSERSFSSTEVLEPMRPWWPVSVRQQHLVETDASKPCPDAPEAIIQEIRGQPYVAFPVVAAEKFKFHDLVMHAAGLPGDVTFGGADGDDDEIQDKKKLGRACDLVFQYSDVLSNTYDILCALEVLHDNKFNMKVVPTTDFEHLRSTMEELLDSEDTVEENEKEILIEGDRIVGNLLKNRAGGTPQLEEIPFEGPPIKIARRE